MASRQEVELKRITEDIRCMSSMLTPFTSLDANSHDDLHAKPHNSNPAENRLLPYLNKRHADDNLVKASLMRKPVGDDVREEPNKFKTAAQQSWKSFISTDLYKKASYGEKENLESGSVRARGSFSSSKPTISAGMPAFTDEKRLQEGFEVSSKPLTSLEINVRDEINLADSGPNVSIGGGKPFDECNTISREDSNGLVTTVLERSKGFYSQKRQLYPRLEDSFCFVPDSSMQTPITESRERAQPLTVLVHENMKEPSGDLCSLQTMKAPLLSQFQARSEQESLHGLATQRPGLANSRLCSHLERPPKQGSTQNYAENPGCEWRQYKTAKTSLVGQSKAQGMEDSCSLQRPKLLKSSVLSQLESQGIQGLQTCEEISTQNSDHVVVLFSVQNMLKESAARISKQQLLKLSSLCMQYSRKILSWLTSLCRKEKIKGSLRRLQQIFPYSPRGFVDLNCQKLPEFSTKLSPLSSKRRLAKDDELKAVLMKINEVLTSMDRTSPESMKERETDSRSCDRAAASLCTG